MFNPDPTPAHLDRAQQHRKDRKELNAALRLRQPHAIGTWLLLAINVAIYMAIAVQAGRAHSLPSDLLIAWGALFAPRVEDGEWWRLLTATFLHIHALHIAVNMTALALVGPSVERLVGTRAFLSFYVAAGLVGTAASLWIHPLTPSAGASGAIIGLYGLLLAMIFERAGRPPLTREGHVPFVSRLLLHVHVQPAVSMIATTLLFGWLDPRADNAAHIGGFLAGGLFGWAAGRDIEWRLPAARVSGAAVLAALGCCAVSLATQREFSDARPAVISVFTVDSRARAKHAQLVASHADHETVKRAIDEEIVPDLVRERGKLDSLGRVPREQEPILADLRKYLALREAFWRQHASAAGRTDEATQRQLEATDQSADIVMRRLLATR